MYFFLIPNANNTEISYLFDQAGKKKHRKGYFLRPLAGINLIIQNIFMFFIIYFLNLRDASFSDWCILIYF